jgi:signal peptidase I
VRNKKEAERDRETRFETLSSNCCLVAVVLFAFVFIFQNFFIPSSSMASTLLVGDHVLVDHETLAPPAKWAPFMHYRDVQRGDIVVFHKPVEDQPGEHTVLVKRVIGIPGDRIHLRNGVVYLNGAAQNEPETAKTTFASYQPYVDDFPSVAPTSGFGVTAEWAEALPSYVDRGDLVVPAGAYFVMGDNRDNSLDSRFWGFVPRANILGRPLFVYWSIGVPESNAQKVLMREQLRSFVAEAAHFLDKTRWSRTLHPVQ